MSKKNQLKKVGASIVAVSLVASISPAFAKSGTQSTSAAFSPNSTKWTLANDPTNDRLTVTMSGSFTQNRIDIVKSDPYDAIGMDFNDQSKTQLDGALAASNYPNPKFDYEDDNLLGDGADEEVEVVTQDEGSLKAGTSYYFNVVYNHKVQKGTGKVLGSTHASDQSLTGEYNTKMTEAIQYMAYALDYAEKASLTKVNQAVSIEESENIEKESKLRKKVLEQEKNNKGFTVTKLEKPNKKIEIEVSPDKENLGDYVDYNKKLAKELLKDKGKVASTVTFKNSLDVKDLKKFSQKYNFKGEKFFGRAIGTDGEKITFSGKGDISDIDLGVVQEVVGKDAKIVGVYAMEGDFENSKVLENVLGEKNVYLVDVVSNVIEKEMNIKASEVEIQSPYWYIEK